MHSRVAAILLVLAVAFLVGGCGGKSTTVSGEVTLDGQPLADGLITYVPLDGKTPNAAAKIQQGKYRTKATPGAMKVQITQAMVTGKRKAYDTPDSPMIDVLGERLPARYNASTELKADLTPGSNTLNWELKSK
jgi:hypothetical protein